MSSVVVMMFGVKSQARLMLNENPAWQVLCQDGAPKFFVVEPAKVGWELARDTTPTIYAPVLMEALQRQAAAQRLEEDWPQHLGLLVIGDDYRDELLLNLLAEVGVDPPAVMTATREKPFLMMRGEARSRTPVPVMPVPRQDAGYFTEFSRLSDDQINRLDIMELEMGVRAHNRLKEVGVRTIGQLRINSADDLLHIPKFGPKSLEDVREAMAAFGLYLRADPRPPISDEDLARPIEDVELHVRPLNRLKQAGIENLRQLTLQTESDLADRGLSPYDIKHVKVQLAAKGWALAT